MPSIRATLISSDNIVIFCQDVDKFAFGLITPLQTNDTGSGHAGVPLLREFFSGSYKTATLINKQSLKLGFFGSSGW